MGASPTRKAPLLPVAMVCSLELAVCDSSQPLYARGFAFYKLLKLWAACRSDDLTGLNPASLVLSSKGLQGVLERTKMTGPGKRVRYLPIFISCKAFLVSPDWLATGFGLWQNGSMAFVRDYFLPLPTADLSGARQIMAKYPQVVAMTKILWHSLRLPIWREGKWSLSDKLLFSSMEPLRFWSEHSERNWLVSLLAMMEVPRDQRDFVGRWSTASSSDEYLRTARQLVMRLQERAAVALEQPAAHDLRFAGIEELLAFLRKQGLDIAEQTDFNSCCNWISFGWLPCKSAMGSSLEPCPLPEPPDDGAVASDQGSDPCPYFIAVVGGRKLRRLHRQGGCGTREMIPLQSLEDAVYDFACKRCWRKGSQPGDSSSASGSSCDTSSSSSENSEGNQSS